MKCDKITFAVKEDGENYNGTRLSARADVILTLKEELVAKAETKCLSKKV
jgi:hypothetical protein